MMASTSPNAAAVTSPAFSTSPAIIDGENQQVVVTPPQIDLSVQDATPDAQASAPSRSRRRRRSDLEPVELFESRTRKRRRVDDSNPPELTPAIAPVARSSRNDVIVISTDDDDEEDDAEFMESILFDDEYEEDEDEDFDPIGNFAWQHHNPFELNSPPRFIQAPQFLRPYLTA